MTPHNPRPAPRPEAPRTQVHAGPTVVLESPGLTIVRSLDNVSHRDPARRGGYLVMQPGRTPTIVLDGMSSEAEQHRAELRCRSELNQLLQERVLHDEERDDTAKVEAPRRRELVHYSPQVVVSREHDPAHHDNPQRRGAFLVLLPGRIPEVVLDGLAAETEQQEALDRCLRTLEGIQHGSGALRQLATALGQEGRPAIFSGAAPAAAAKVSRGQRLGDRLVVAGLITQSELAATLRTQARAPARTRPRLGSMLVAQGCVTAVQVARVLGAQRGMRATASTATLIEVPLRALFPAELLYSVEAAPLFLSGRTLAVAMCDPQDAQKVMVLQERTPLHIEPLQAAQIHVRQLLRSLPSDGAVEASGGAARSTSALHGLAATSQGSPPAGRSSGSNRGSTATVGRILIGTPPKADPPKP